MASDVPLKSGDILSTLVIGGEPNRLFMLARSVFTGMLPDSGGVTIIKQRRSRWDDSFDFSFASITRTERKLADVRLAELCNKMTAEENEVAAALNDVLWGWLSGRVPEPRFEKVVPFASVGLTLSGAAEDILAAVETLTTLEPVHSISLGLAILQGMPRRPEARWLPALRSTEDVASARRNFQTWSGQIPPDDVERVNSLLIRVSKLYRRRAEVRVRELRRTAEEVLGQDASEWLTTPRRFDKSPLASVETTYQFEDDLQWLKAKAEPKRRRVKFWRAAT